MASPLQNRIVGMVILVALAVIFLPDLLDGKKVEQDEELEAIPLRPTLTVQQGQVDFPGDFNDRIAQAQPQPVNEDEFTAPPEPVSADITRDTDAPAWVIRLGAFRNAESVDRLIAELREHGYNAFARTVRSDNGELRVLMVGPDLDESALQAQLSDLKEITTLDGVLVPYQPVQE